MLGGDEMLRLNVLKLLEKHGKTKYWLHKQLGMSYQNFHKMIHNETKSISYKNMENLCVIFSVRPDELFEYNFEEPENE